MVTYYDVILAAIAAGFVIGIGAAWVLGVSVTTGVVAGTVMGALLIVDALFRHPPTDDHALVD